MENNRTPQNRWAPHPKRKTHRTHRTPKIVGHPPPQKKNNNNNNNNDTVTHIHTHTYVYINIYIYICTYTHTHTHIHTRVFFSIFLSRTEDTGGADVRCAFKLLEAGARKKGTASPERRVSSFLRGSSKGNPPKNETPKYGTVVPTCAGSSKHHRFAEQNWSVYGSFARMKLYTQAFPLRHHPLGNQT